MIRFARQVFDEMLERDIVSWSSMRAAYVHCNLPSDALLLFQCVKLANEKPNSVTLVSLLGACTRILNIRLGKCIHSHIVTSGIELHVELETALLGMYAKCGHIQQAFCIFNSMDDKNLQTWTIMISGLADHGHKEDAVSLLPEWKNLALGRIAYHFLQSYMLVVILALLIRAVNILKKWQVFITSGQLWNITNAWWICLDVLEIRRSL